MRPLRWRIFVFLPNRLEALRGNRKGQFSICINDQWRICFRWDDRDADDIEVVDYHEAHDA